MKSIVLALFLVSAVSCGWADHLPFCLFPNTFPVTMQTSPAQVDLEQYQGTWYEVFRKPAWFEKDCICAQAHYTLNPAGFVEVVNTCTRADMTIKGRPNYAPAYPRNAPQNTRLEVYFNPMIGGSYWILDIDPAYQWVVVGDPCKSYGWLLARSKTVDSALLADKIALLKAKGYDVSDLIFRDKQC